MSRNTCREPLIKLKRHSEKQIRSMEGGVEAHALSSDEGPGSPTRLAVVVTGAAITAGDQRKRSLGAEGAWLVAAGAAAAGADGTAAAAARAATAHAQIEANRWRRW